MIMNRKQELIAKVVALLDALIEVEDNTPPITVIAKKQPIEMLTIKECTEAVRGLSEHTVRQLIVQDKLPHIRTGQGNRGKILVSKAALLEYLGGAA